MAFLPQILLFATFDDASNALKDIQKTWIRKFGSQQIGDLKFRGSWVMVGQRGADKADSEAIVHPGDNRGAVEEWTVLVGRY